MSSNISFFTSCIKDYNLTSHILDFVSSPSIPLVNQHFKSVAYSTVYPWMLHACKQFIDQNPGKCAFLSPYTRNLIDRFSTDSVPKDRIRNIYNAIKADARANGNALAPFNEVHLIPFLKRIEQEDRDLITFFKAINRKFHLLPEREWTAKEIRTWMEQNKALLKDKKSLNLSGCGLKSVPKEIAYFENVVILDLFENQLTALPREIHKLSKLTMLNMHTNQFTQFPEVLLILPQLEDVNLAFNAIRLIPIKDQDLPGLKKLDISFNRLTELPKTLHLRPSVALDIRGNFESTQDLKKRS